MECYAEHPICAKRIREKWVGFSFLFLNLKLPRFSFVFSFSFLKHSFHGVGALQGRRVCPRLSTKEWIHSSPCQNILLHDK